MLEAEYAEEVPVIVQEIGDEVIRGLVRYPKA